MLAISVDSVELHQRWNAEELSRMVEGGVPFPMLSDPGGRIGELYGVYARVAQVDIRGRFLIDPDGLIQSMEVLAPPVGRNVAEIIRQIQAFQHVRRTQEVEHTPEGWVPGQPALRHDPADAGQVWKVWKPRRIDL